MTAKSPKTPTNPTQQGIAKSLRFLALVLNVVVLVVGVMFYVSIFRPLNNPAKIIMVDKGDTYQSLLMDKSWQKIPKVSSWAIRLYLKYAAKEPLHAGAYRMPANVSIKQAVGVLQKGADASMIKVQIIEGKTIKDLYYKLKTTKGIKLEALAPLAKGEKYTWADVAKDNTKVAKALGIEGVTHLEGYFAPDTYYFNESVSDVAILKQLYQRQQKLLSNAWQSRDKELPYKNAQEMLIMASIIEKETGVPSERPQVSAVFVNRLRLGMKLQTDPTIIYGLFDRYDGKIYRSNIDEKNAYNTYQIDGLPATPIALPSMQAINAAAHPDTHNYLYFVATGKGGHTFSETLAEHNKAVAEYRKVIKEK